jgi:AbiV family abortive infection protein
MWNRMPKKYPYPFSEQELMLGCKRCIENVTGLLESAKTLNVNQSTQKYALGLYMYALEEYGKAIMLKKAITGNRKRYHIFGWILGTKNPDQSTENEINSHDKKIMTAYNNLPFDCRVIVRGVIINEASSVTRTIKTTKKKYGLDNQVSVLKGSTGTFSDTQVSIFDYNLDLKTACFYIDWDENDKSWKLDVVTGKEDLNKNINCLEDALTRDI